MLNLTLIKKELRTNYKIILIFLALITMYSTVIIVMFDPDLGTSLEMIAESMPELFAVFGMTDAGTTLLEFLNNYLYGFILTVIPSICIILLTNRLVTRYIDRGSMAYLLATPNTRKKIITTQAIFLSATIAFLVIFATVLIIIVSALSFPNMLDIKNLLLLNIGLFGLLLFISSICFFGACWFNESKLAMGLGGGAIIAFLLLQMLSQVGKTFAFLKYFTPLTLFDTKGIITGDTNSYLLFIILYIAAFLVFYIAIKKFCRKDLSI